MSIKSSATQAATRPILPDYASSSGSLTGILWGLLGVAAFSLTVPFTRAVVEDGAMSGLFVGSGRAVIAAALAAAALTLTRQRLPRGRQWARLGICAGGLVLGFPVLTSYALAEATASHGAVVVALLPAATAVVAALRTGERTRPVFWTATAAGAVAAIAFAALHGGGAAGLSWSDLLLVAAVVVAAFGYAEGGLLARELGAWQTISWALVLAAPVMIGLTVFSLTQHIPSATPWQWAAFAYLGVVSMFLGFFAWYRGLAIGPMTRVSQIQLTQPVMSICWAALILGEDLNWLTAVGGLAVILCAAAAVRVRMTAQRE